MFKVGIWASLGRTLVLPPTDRKTLCTAVASEETKYTTLLQSLVESVRDEDPAGYAAAAEVLALLVAEVKRSAGTLGSLPAQSTKSLVDIYTASQAVNMFMTRYY